MTIAVLILAYTAFISLGMPDGLLGVAWPQIRGEFNQSLDALGILLVANLIGYTLSSFISGWTSRKLGIGRLVALSCGMTGIALVGYTLVPSWLWFIPFGVLSGMGGGAVDAGLNSFFERNHGERLMQWLHASFGIGITLSPLIMTWAVTIQGQWRLGYWIVGAFQGFLALAFYVTRNLWADGKGLPHPKDIHGSGEMTLNQTLLNPRSWLSAGLFFVYVGMEITMGHWVYTLLTEGRGVNPGIAGLWTSGYWASFTVGRILAGIIAHRVASGRLISVAVITAITGIGLVAWGPVAWVTLGGIALYGISLAPIFPALVSSTSRRVGWQHSTNTVGMQIAFAGLGVGFGPAAVGVVAARWGVELIPYSLLILSVVFGLLFSIANLIGENGNSTVDPIGD